MTIAKSVKITPVVNGFIVEVGCSLVVFPSVIELTLAVSEYYSQPAETQEKYLKNAVNKSDILPPPPQQLWPSGMGDTIRPVGGTIASQQDQCGAQVTKPSPNIH